MGWTNEQIDLLRTLWNAGQTASVIAEELVKRFGDNISRNAVIGKAHRLKLIARAKASSSMKSGQSMRSRRKTASDEGKTQTLRTTQTSVMREQGQSVRSGADRKACAQRQNLRNGAVSAIEPSVHAVERAMESLRAVQGVAVNNVGEHQCRWPIGDPRSPDFRFCGCKAQEGLPYCAEHARVAFQTVSRRPRLDLSEPRYVKR